MFNNTISSVIKQGLYFNVNRKNGRWVFSKKPIKISEDKTTDELKEWDDLIKTLIINVTDQCNLNCVYCSRQCARQKPGNIKKELIEKILRKTIKYAKDNNIKLTIQFHGGEPLIEFNKIIESIDNIPKKDLKNLKLRIQTNGTLLTENIVKECKKRDIEIGISLDGRKIENDLMRKDAKSYGTFEKVKKSLKIIRKYQKEISCLTVVTNINVENLNKILDFFDRLGINNIGFLPLYEEPTTRTIKRYMVPNMKKLARNQKRLFDRWIELLENKKNKNINITTFQILIWNLLSSNSNIKKFRVNCGVGVNSLFVEEDGSVWACGAFSYAKKLKIGDLNTQELSELQKGNSYKKFQKRITSNVKGCKNCAFQFICKGGCVANGFRKEGDIFGLDIWCDYWKNIIKHIILRIYTNPKIIKLIPNYNIKKNDRPPCSFR